jgi:hypothetical protein
LALLTPVTESKNNLPMLAAMPFPPQEDYAMGQADGELLELGKLLARLQPELAEMLRWVDEVWELYAAEVRRRGTWPDDPAEWTWRDAAAYCAARESVDLETEIGAAYVRAMDALDACYTRLDPICYKILSLKAHTRKGRAVRKMARAIQTGGVAVRNTKAKKSDCTHA